MIVLGFLRRQAFALAIIACAASAYLWPGLYIEWFGVKLMPLAAVGVAKVLGVPVTTLSTAGEGGAWGVASLACKILR